MVHVKVSLGKIVNPRLALMLEVKQMDHSFQMGVTGLM